jgi:hypothetical protein
MQVRFLEASGGPVGLQTHAMNNGLEQFLFG